MNNIMVMISKQLHAGCVLWISAFVSDLPGIKATRQGEISTLHVVMHNAVDVGRTGGAFLM